MSVELLSASLSDKTAQIRRKTISASELVALYLDRTRQLDPRLGAYLTVCADRARADAQALDDAVARGESVGPLAGIPVALKDVLVTRDLETTAGSQILRGWKPPYDATVVEKLRAAGAIVLGKLNCDEFAMGSSTENSSYFPCHNPWDLARVPGGSSGGSAAAVAAGLCAASLGTDTGGSIRQPAAFCGVVGMKPSYGLVSRHGVIAYASSLDQVGPMTRQVEDAALLLEVIAGGDPRDATSLDRPVPGFLRAATQPTASLRIGLPREYFAASIDPEIRGALERTASTLATHGASVREVSLPHTELALAAYYLIAPAEASSNLARYDGIRFGHRTARSGTLGELYERTRGEGFGPEVKRRIMLGTYALRAGYYDAYYRKAQQVRTLIRRDFDQVFAEVDVLLTPTTPTLPFVLGSTPSGAQMYLADVFTLGCNLAGIPGISVPCAASTSGLPIGAQLLGPMFSEERLFSLAAFIEKQLAPPRWPPLAAEEAP
jgi:aspartyl-tRNA(Asn)/glutamyl-tRNA(Gln) amidotransferase subunit A